MNLTHVYNKHSYIKARKLRGTITFAFEQVKMSNLCGLHTLSNFLPHESRERNMLL